jgi:hypothetical protein
LIQIRAGGPEPAAPPKGKRGVRALLDVAAWRSYFSTGRAAVGRRVGA